MAEHLGALATGRSIRTFYWWPGLSSFVSQYVQGCAICQQFKVQTQPQHPSLVLIPSLSEHIFGQVRIDFMMDLPPSDGFDSIMVIVDHGLSKGVIAQKLALQQKKLLDCTSIMFILALDYPIK